MTTATASVAERASQLHKFDQWRAFIDESDGADGVRAALEDYISSIPPAVVGVLPQNCQAAMMNPDVHAAAVVLLQTALTFTGHAQTGYLLHDVARTFAAASTRISRLKRNRPA